MLHFDIIYLACRGQKQASILIGVFEDLITLNLYWNVWLFPVAVKSWTRQLPTWRNWQLPWTRRRRRRTCCCIRCSLWRWPISCGMVGPWKQVAIRSSQLQYGQNFVSFMLQYGLNFVSFMLQYGLYIVSFMLQYGLNIVSFMLQYGLNIVSFQLQYSKHCVIHAPVRSKHCHSCSSTV